MFTRRQRYWFAFVFSLGLLFGLSSWSAAHPLPPAQILAWGMFAGLWAFASIFGFPIAGGNSNLGAVVAVAALLALGLVPAMWAVVVGAFIYALVRARYAAPLGFETEGRDWIVVLGRSGSNTMITGGSLFVAYTGYAWLGGRIPLWDFNAQEIWPAFGVGVLFFLFNYVLLGGYVALERPSQLRSYLRTLPHLVRHELLPQAFAPLIALIYTRLGYTPFGLFALALVVVTLLIRSQLRARQRLWQSLQENQALQALGQAFARSLDQREILAALQTHVPKLMWARHFYVALYDATTDEVSFPLYVEHGVNTPWPSRAAGHGLTEHVIRTRQPLFLRSEVAHQLRALGVVRMGPPARSWIGVPILAAEHVLGVLALQTLAPDEPAYTEGQRDLLVTIAAQLAVAIHNAHLYRQTDQALTERVQQLSSILATTHDSIVLLDHATRVLTTNRAAARLLGTTQSVLVGQTLAARTDLLERLGFVPAEFQNVITNLTPSPEPLKRIYSWPPRDLERSLTAVQGPGAYIAGWLLIVRDVTEEQALARLRQDLTNMLVHDLKSPLASILTSLALLEMRLPSADRTPAQHELLRVMGDSGNHMLQLIDELLEIAQLESGALPINWQVVSPIQLLLTTVERLLPTAQAAGVTLRTEVQPALPDLQADPELIGRVLGNLVDNAIKFTPEGRGVSVWIKQLPTEWQLGVTDEGPGLSPEAQAQLFQKFHKIKAVTGRRTGTGLGLAFCKLVVEAHQGRIWIESEPSAGSTFIFALPLRSILPRTS